MTMRRLVSFVVFATLAGLGACAHSTGLRQVDRLADALDARPVRYSRSLLERVREAGALQDVVDVMDDKARVLITVARLADSDLTAYQAVAGESGPVPDKRVVRDLALGFLVHSNLYLNSEPTRQLLAERVRDADDLRTQLLLAPILDSLLGSTTRTAMALPEATLDLHPAVASWIDWTTAQLAKPFDPLTFELVLVRVEALGRFGTDLGIADRAGTLLDTIIAARGDFALTAGAPAARFDLALHALAARYDLATVARGYHVPALPRASEPLDVWTALRDTGRIATPRANAEFDALVAPLIEPVIHYDIYTQQRIREAFALVGVDDTRRSAMLRRLLFLRPNELSPFDTKQLHDVMVLPRGPNDIIVQAARILADEPAMLDSDRAARDAVGRLAFRPFDTTGDTARDQPLVLLHPVLMRYLRAAPDKARIEVLRAWMTSIRELAARTDSHIYYANEASIARLVALAELAPGVGLADEARATCDAVIASPAAAMTRRTHEVLVRGATIARALL